MKLINEGNFPALFKFITHQEKIEYVKFDNNTKLKVDEKTCDCQKPCLLHRLPQKKIILPFFLRSLLFYLPSPLNSRMQFFSLYSLSHKGFNTLHLTSSASPFMILAFFKNSLSI